MAIPCRRIGLHWQTAFRWHSVSEQTPVIRIALVKRSWLSFAPLGLLLSSIDYSIFRILITAEKLASWRHLPR